jgi:hypothetical protein
MRVTVISLLLALISLPVALASELELISPEKISINESFQASIKSDVIETADVKIYINDPNLPSVILSKIQKDDSSWQSSFNYLTAAYPDKKEFNILAVKSPGMRQICAKLRIGKKIVDSLCNQIFISSAESEVQEDAQGKDTPSDNSDFITKETSKQSSKEDNTLPSKKKTFSAAITLNQVQENQNTKNSQKEQVNIQEPMKLTNISELDKAVYIDKPAKEHLIILLSFSLFCLVLLLLILFNKI